MFSIEVIGRAGKVHLFVEPSLTRSGLTKDDICHDLLNVSRSINFYAQSISCRELYCQQLLSPLAACWSILDRIQLGWQWLIKQSTLTNLSNFPLQSIFWTLQQVCSSHTQSLIFMHKVHLCNTNRPLCHGIWRPSAGRVMTSMPRHRVDRVNFLLKKSSPVKLR